MKRTTIPNKIFFVFLLLLQASFALASDFVFRKFNAIDLLPIDEVRCMHQDELGFVWLGTSNGLFRYDGYHVKSYRNTQQAPFLLSSESVACLADDGTSLWIGTKKGLNRMDLRTGLTRAYHFSDFDNSDIVNKLLVTSTHDLWVGTEGGLYRYDKAADKFTLYCDQRRNSKVPHSSITCLYEGRKGTLWIGTWDRGLYRFTPTNGLWYELPPFNPRHSAQAIYENAHGELWVGTWGCGLYKISNPYSTSVPLQFTNYTMANTHGNLTSDIVWNISFDSVSNHVWIGMPNGLSYLDTSMGMDNVYTIPNEELPGYNFFGQGASSFFNEKTGRLWFSATHRGIVCATKTPTNKFRWMLPSQFLYNDYLSAISFMPGKRLLVGLHSNGFLDVDMTSYSDYRYTPLSTVVYGFYALSNGSQAVLTEREGVLIYRDGSVVSQIKSDNSPWLTDNCVYSMYADNDGTWLLGTYRGLCARFANGDGVYFNGEKLRTLSNSRIQSIAKGKGCLWLGTHDNGILQLVGNLRKPSSLTLKQYDVLHGSKLKLDNVKKILVDHNGRVWACSRSAGLLVYDSAKDGFVSANQKYGLPMENVYSVEIAKNGDLIASMRNSIAILRLDAKGNLVKMRMLSRHNLMGMDAFAEGLSSISPDGMVCFGGYNGVVSFRDTDVETKSKTSSVYITDIKVFGKSLDFTDFTDSSSVQLPPYTKSITLNSNQRDVTLEFSTLNFDNLDGVRFSYKLDGYDKEWKFTDANVSSANYNNLLPGRYVFHIRATDENGNWGDETIFVVNILNPWYLRWYAWLFYTFAMLAFAYFVYRYFKNKELSRREVQMAKLEKQNIETLNHKKLQFFTNITHDLMTPLTVISATVANLSNSDPANAEAFNIIDGNVNRLMRMLQQILEFRKSETGNLHLLVSYASLSDFLRKEIESLRPLTNKKQLHLSFVCNPDEIEGYFDSDKLDKIIYNLVSNAIKYNSVMGYIQVTLSCLDGKTASITVKDNGAGIAEEKLPRLFTRFYEGEHRKFRTYGTGIGLSLTKDLVELHHGSISVDSKLGEGTMFTITLPISKEAFTADEIEDSSSAQLQLSANPSEDEVEDNASSATKCEYTILVVEDNEELLSMLAKLFSQKYNVVKAFNGKDAVNKLSSDNTIDIVVTDMMMPIMDGVELTRTIHSNPATNTLPVVMLTAKRDDEDRAEAYRAGADAYITKPFNTSVLLARVENLLQNRKKAQQELNAKFFSALKDVNLSPDDEEFVSMCVNCVQEHLADADFSLDTFAEAMNISKSTLYKKLHAATSFGPSAFVRNIRMRYAAELISSNPKARIAYVAFAVGYNDPKYFSSCFKKEFGVLPSEYGRE